MSFEIAEPGWVAIGRDDVTGCVSVKRVGFFEVGDQGVRPLVKDHDGVFWEPGPETVEVIRTDPLHAAKLAWMHKLVGVADRCTTDEARADLKKIADWLADWQPGDPGLSLAGGDDG
ncbi:hypothetical protein [Streptomyces sp. NRRL WC-3626]|uniref:hypothetical protein n=1 Tax=Streptomyces sp. NRRL WC-3626 TaxID=1463926 RepID=UPI000D11D723|nr:hypothetical protein [Streptomyces sp. NRRL WC-3626]